MLLAYKESEDFVGYLTAHYGIENLREILKHLEKGDNIDRAMMKSLSKPFREVQEEWVHDMRRRSEWMIWAGQHMYDFLFFMAADLTIAAFIRLKI